MKTVLGTVAAAFSMFSALPVPQAPWDERHMRWMLAAFPLIGLVTGAACWAWWALCSALALPAILRGAGLCLLPVLITGGVHLDGYADTCDALASHAPPERRQEILKDPRLGAFAAIRLCCYFLASFALWTAMPRFDGPAFLLALCMSRALSGLAIAAFPLARNSGLAHTFAAAADRKKLRSLLAALSILLAAMLCLRGIGGTAMAAAAFCVFLYYRPMARRNFGGISGDLAGWFLQTAELWMLGAACTAQYLEPFFRRLL
ncbi:adenosylcobinamide-GDP ribazoletransferase [uncultured Oscillibacter sp.]|uniref:adenosylcobinamide-GDP ribazoletransferase n=1 Tax=uncultured Oscillibacter sp. TaxID=876091 RepID=UPI0025F40FFD|nr:adenosylcobinamide-GDP ribazoletransferase [uncultured Oscillibacter sp.]